MVAVVVEKAVGGLKNPPTITTCTQTALSKGIFLVWRNLACYNKGLNKNV